MQPTDRPEFLKIVNGLAAIKPGAKISTEGLGMWWAAMADWTLADFRAAAAHLATAVEFMPNPYHFEQLRRRGLRTAPEAFAIAREVWRSGGTTSGDNLIDRVVESLGGYRTLGMTSTEQLHFLERRFVDNYATLQDATEVRDALPQLTANTTRRLAGPQRVTAALPTRKPA